jgi:hypothetical protein
MVVTEGSDVVVATEAMAKGVWELGWVFIVVVGGLQGGTGACYLVLCCVVLSHIMLCCVGTIVWDAALD